MPVVINGSTGISGTDGSASTPAVQGTDTNTGLFFPAADTIAFAEGGTEVMRIDSAGNVGIGTTTPTNRLTVNANSRFDGNIESSVSPFIYSWQGGTSGQVRSGFLLDGSGASLQLYTVTAERMRITDSGNVSIGNSSPITRLDVTGIATIRNNSAAWNTTPNTNYGLNFQAASTGTCHITSYSAGGSTEIAFATNSGGAAAVERGRFTSTGNFQFNSGYGSVATAFGCRAWVNFNGTGTVAIRASGNVSSITDGGTGLYTVNFTTAMPDANYSAVKSENYWSIGDIFNFNVNNLTLRVYESISPGVTRDTELICVAVFR